MGKRKRNTAHIIHCGQHKDKAKKDTEKECLQCISIKNLNQLPTTKLPRNEEVLARLLTLNAENPNASNIWNLARKISYLWILSNVYTKRETRIVADIEALYAQYRKLQKVSNNKKGAKFLAQLKEFKDLLQQLFDIKCHDFNRNKNEAQF